MQPVSRFPAVQHRMPAGVSPKEAFPTTAYEAEAIPTTQASLNVDALLTRKLADPTLKLTPTESIALLTHCIMLGKKEAENADRKDLIVFIGNTGAGKSTFINYLCGCKMQRVHPQTLGIPTTGRVVIVKPVAQGGTRDEIMKIGHLKTSMTFMPQIVTDHQNYTYCDCPGFMDNRGAEINIANAVNIRNAFMQAHSVKVVMLVSFDSCEDARADGLKKMLNICSCLFGSRENLVKYKNSILLGITQIPFKEVADDDEEPEVLNVERLKKWIATLEGITDIDKSTLEQLSEQLFIYDPCDSKNLRYEGALKREQILAALNHLVPINKPLAIFKTVLTPADLQGLVTIAQEIKSSIETLFGKSQLNSDDFKQIASYQESLNQLEIIEHPYVARLTTETRHVITSYFQGLVHQFELRCVDTSADLSKQSEGILKIIKEGIQHFDRQIQAQIDTKALDDRYKKLVLTQAAKNEVLRLADLEKNFRTYCAYTHFDKAKALLQNIEQSLQNFDSKFSQSGESHNVKLGELRTLFQSTKENYSASLEKQNAQSKKLDELEKKLEQEKKERELQTKLQEEKQAKEKKDADAAFEKLQMEIARKAKQDMEAQVLKDKQLALRANELLIQQQRQPQILLQINKRILRNQILGEGPATVIATPVGPHLLTSFGQCHPIVWGTPRVDQIVIATSAGLFHLDQSGATPVNMTPNGPVPWAP